MKDIRYLHRNITDKLLQALEDTPVVVLQGPRQSGKSTLVREISRRFTGAEYFTLDDPLLLSSAEADPAGFIGGLKNSVIIDEIQRAPALLIAIKQAVDMKRVPGKFLLTGSSHILNHPRISDSLAGRMETHTLFPFSQSELGEEKTNFPDSIFKNTFCSPKTAATKTEILNKAVNGGFPETQTRRGNSRKRAWFSAYLDAVISKDLRDVTNIRGLTEIPRILEILSLRTSSILNIKDISRDTGMNQVTLKRYTDLLENTFIIKYLRPWHTSQLKRIVKLPKTYFTDTGISGFLTGSSEENIRCGTEGPLIENFVFTELLKQLNWSESSPEIYFYRDHDGNEVDFILEWPAGEIAGIEVKAGNTLSNNDFKGLKHIKKMHPERFLSGILLYTGDRQFFIDSNIQALPMNALWQQKV